MTGTTSFLDLITYSNVTDASALFLDFRTDIAGSVSSSNMQLIDDFAYLANGSIVDLMAEQPIYNTTGSYASSNNYGATVSTISAYETNQVLSLRLDVENDGEVNLRINALASKALNKIDDNGDLVVLEAGDLKKNREYFFKYNGTSFTLIGATVADQVSILGTANNLSMVSGCKVLIDSGVSVSSGSRISGSYVEFLANNKISASYIDAQGSDDNLLRHFGGSAIDSGIVVSSGSRISGSYVATQGTDDNLLRHFSGSAVDSGVIVSSGSRISGSYIASLGSENNLLRHVNGSATDSGVVVSSGSRISGSYVDSLGTENNLLRYSDGSAIDSGIIVSSETNISGSFINSGSMLSVVSGSLGLSETGIASGSYNQVEVDVYGRITEGSFVSGLATIEGSGVMSDTTGSTVKHNVSAVTAGSFTNANIEVDALGHIMSAVSGTGGSSIVLDWARATGTNFTSSATASWQDVTSATVTLTLAKAGVVIGIASGGFKSSGGWNAFIGVNIDGSAPPQILNTILFSSGTAFAIRDCSAGDVVVKMQAYAYSTDTATVEYSQVMAIALAT